MNKILIIQSSYLKPNGKVYKSIVPGTVSFSLPLLAGLTPKEFGVEIMDDVLENIDFNADCDLVGITAMSFQAPRAYQIANEFRKRGKKVVMGGFHASFFPEDAIKHCDAVVIGEAENIWAKLIEDFRNGNPQKFYQSPELHSLKGLPVPRYDLLEIKLHGGLPIQAARGCPYQCDFCWVQRLYRRSYRKRPIAEVVRDIQSSRGYVNRFLFVDDNLMLDKNYAKDLFKALIPLQIEWLTQSDISIAEDPELLDLCKESGCIFVFIGIESLNPDSLDSVRKNTVDPKHVSENLRKIRRKGIPFCLSFIFGFDHDTKDTFRSSINFAIKNRAHYITPFIYTPIPGSKFDLQLQAEGRYIPARRSDFSSFSHMHLQFIPKNLSVQDFEKEFRKALSRFYSFRSAWVRILLPPLRYRNGLLSFKYNFWHFITNLFFMFKAWFGKHPVSSL